jgi:hypothetical protein
MKLVSEAGRFDFNLEWSPPLAPGGFPLNPSWRWQQDHAGVPNASLCHYFSKTVVVGSVTVRVPDFADCTNQADASHVDTPDGYQCFHV